MKGSNYQWTWGPDTLDNTDLCFTNRLLLTTHTVQRHQPISSLRCLVLCLHCLDLRNPTFYPSGQHIQTKGAVTCARTHSSSNFHIFSDLLRNRTKAELRKVSRVSATTLPFSKWEASDKGIWNQIPPLFVKKVEQNNFWIPLVWWKNMDLADSPELEPCLCHLLSI